jgi:hypothetical protein
MMNSADWQALEAPKRPGGSQLVVELRDLLKSQVVVEGREEMNPVGDTA